jgi:hypothetical protein
LEDKAKVEVEVKVGGWRLEVNLKTNIMVFII